MYGANPVASRSSVSLANDRRRARKGMGWLGHSSSWLKVRAVPHDNKMCKAEYLPQREAVLEEVCTRCIFAVLSTSLG